jgi:hypothetical protein
LPLFTDERQAQRAKEQEIEIGKRLGRRTATLERIIIGMKALEVAGVAASLALGAGVVINAARVGGKWAVVKTLAKVAGSAAAAEGAGEAIERGLEAAGASKETIRGMRLAAEVVTWLLLLRRVSIGVGAKSQPSAAPKEPAKPSAPPIKPVPSPPHKGTGLIPSAPEEMGRWGEARLKLVLSGRGFKPRSPFKTGLTRRYIDRIVDDVAHEAKAGVNVGLTSEIRVQALKDAELIAKKRIRGAHWHFFQGAQKELLDFLTTNGITYTVY